MTATRCGRQECVSDNLKGKKEMDAKKIEGQPETLMLVRLFKEIGQLTEARTTREVVLEVAAREAMDWMREQVEDNIPVHEVPAVEARIEKLRLALRGPMSIRIDSPTMTSEASAGSPQTGRRGPDDEPA